MLLLILLNAVPLLAEGILTWFSPHLGAWMRVYLEWILSLGKPLAIGLVVLAVVLAVLGYFFVRLAWRGYVIFAWRRRRAKRIRA